MICQACGLPESKCLRQGLCWTAMEARGRCPASGLSIAECWDSICDCAFAAPTECSKCGVAVWNIHQHNHIIHEPGSDQGTPVPQRPKTGCQTPTILPVGPEQHRQR